MRPAAITDFLKALGVFPPVSQNRTGWIVSSCPLAPWTHAGGIDQNPSFGVKIEAGDPFANCFSCGWHGALSTLVLELKRRDAAAVLGPGQLHQAMLLLDEAENEFELSLDAPDIEQLVDQPQGPHVFADWWLDSFAGWRQVAAAVAYLAERGVAPGIADRLDLRFDSEEGRICFPVRDFKQRLVGLHGRALDPKTEPRYRMYTYQHQNNPLHWLGESWVDLDRPILVVEGPFDLASCLRVYGNTVSPLFACSSFAKLRRLIDASDWVTLLDRGVGGDNGRQKISAGLPQHTIDHLLPPADRKDPGEMSVAELRQLLGERLELDHFSIA